MELYSKKESIHYYCIDLLWGQKLYQELRFVLVEMNGIQSILAITSLALEPPSVIRLYSYRFRIECTFRKHFFRLLGQKPELCITQIIHGLQEEPEEQWDFLAS